MKMEYVGPGSKRTMDVKASEVKDLEKTGLWKKSSKGAKQESATTDEKKEGDS
jgi:hypothetical protein